jgi:hypothetical protein
MHAKPSRLRQMLCMPLTSTYSPIASERIYAFWQRQRGLTQLVRP